MPFSEYYFYMHMIKYIGLYRQLIILKISKIMFKVCDIVISV